MYDMKSILFKGVVLLQAIADDERQPNGARTRISRSQNSRGETVRKVQEALLTWRPDVLPRGGADAIYGNETARAVRALKIDVIGVPPSEVIDDVGPLTVQTLDGIQAAAEAPSPPATFIRRSAWTMQQADPSNPFDPITLAYAKAIRTMQARPATDPTSWAFQAAIHGSFNAVPAGARWNQCQHGHWFFLPWHRLYVYYFERIVRAAVIADGGPADFALPYWDYDAGGERAALPPACREPLLPGPTGGPNPLFIAPPGRDVVMARGGRLHPSVFDPTASLSLRSFSGPPGSGFGGGRSTPIQFAPPTAGTRGALEGTPHNLVHVRVGGSVGSRDRNCGAALMTKPECAALDPIFWMHHANVDRLWNRWLAPPDVNPHPAETDWRGARFTFYDETGAQVTKKVDDSLDTEAQLQYRYEDQPSFVPQGALMAPAPRPPRMVAATDLGLDLVGSVASAAVNLVADGHEELQKVVDGDARAVVNVEDIDPESDPAAAYAVYLVLPDGERRHIGNISLFGIQNMRDADRSHDTDRGFRQSFDVTELVSQLPDLADTAGPDQVTVELDPILNVPAPGDEDLAAEEAARVGNARIGRISLFVE